MQPGSRIGPFEVIGHAGAGGMGVVYRAYDPRLQRTVAIKVIGAAAPTPDARARLLEEARSASALNHPHICTIYDVGEAEGHAYIAMECLEGQPLSVVIGGRPFSMPEVLRIGLQVADAIAHAHERGVLHRDLKAANVIVGPSGVAKVVDFGLAKRIGEAAGATQSHVRTAPGTVMGTIYAMSPEQLCGEPADVRSDVWAIGVLLHEMAAGAPPFAGRTPFELTTAILRDPAAQLPDHVPVAFRRTVERCLAKNVLHRYQSAAEVRAALEALAVDVATPSPSSSAQSPAVSDVRSGVIGAPIPLPGAVAGGEVEAPFVGRELQLAEMERIWEQVRSGRRRMMLLAGEPGIGKTRLTFEFCRRCHAEGAVVVVGRCSEEALIPYQPFVEALDYYVGVCSETELRRHLTASGAGSELARLIPALARRAPNLPQGAAADPEGQRYRLFEAVSALPSRCRASVRW